ncbi:L-threonylcarbamoyladenylate synthase [Rhodobacteraceae bacterium XHP0102]|nr:L-threonylcarbamoyladenylate synthase [Rhodobacteraceae bacterium XHP0102]
MPQASPPADRPERLAADAHGIAAAAGLLRAGKLVAFPTETVYGLGADARNDLACAKVFEAKGRPTFNPLIVHLRDVEAAEGLAEFSSMARDLAAAFWPGPLTLVLPLRSDHGLSSLVSAALPTVALRVPQNPVAQALLAEFDGPIAAPSANRSGHLSPTQADHVMHSLSVGVAAVLDGGDCPVGLESTIVDASGRSAKLLREGGIAREELERITGPLVADLTPGRIAAPGQMASHYAPRAALRINSDLRDPTRYRIAFGPQHDADVTLSESADLREAASRLFGILHLADARVAAGDFTGIDVAPIPAKGLGLAINDRLLRAAAPRP